MSTEKGKRDKYRQLNHDPSSEYYDVRFINPSLSALGIFGNSYEPFIDMLKEIDFEKQYINFIVQKLTTNIIRSTYYIFCMHNKPCTNPNLQVNRSLNISTKPLKYPLRFNQF